MILIVGAGRFDIYEKALKDAFCSLSADARCWLWFDKYFESMSIANRFQNKYLVGPKTYRLNRDLVAYCRQLKPDLVFLYRNTHLWEKTIREIKHMGCKIFSYNNDDPFAEKHPVYLWRNYFRSLSHCDHIFVYRHKNISDLAERGYANVSLLRSYYISERNYPVSAQDDYAHDITFIGHWENDSRDEYIKELLDNKFDVGLYGTYWHKSRYYGLFRSHFGQIRALRKDYNVALSSSKIALSFLSKRNNDTYTRRAFEIPAAGTFMLSEYSDDMNSMFKGGVEAEYFRDKEELVDKVRHYLVEDEKREKIAQAGYDRLVRDGHEVCDRARQILSVYEELED
jgi:spore maturation protein CgeB